MLEDIAIFLTGGKVITKELGIKLENVTLNDLGKAKKIVVDKDDTTIIDGAGKKTDIEGRVKQIRARWTRLHPTTITKNSRSVSAKLVGGVAQSSGSARPPKSR